MVAVERVVNFGIAIGPGSELIAALIAFVLVTVASIVDLAWQSCVFKHL